MKKVKASQSEIIRQWFGPETRTGRTDIHNACVQVSEDFFAPSGASHPQYFTAADRAAFAKAVQKQMSA